MVLNSLMREDDLAGSGLVLKVMIGGAGGCWRVQCQNWSSDNRLEETSVIYEGDDWSEATASYQKWYGDKRQAGYRPVIPEIAAGPASYRSYRQRNGSVDSRLLSCYSERQADDEIYEQLRSWRRKRAQQERKAPFVLAPDRLLKLLAAFLPQSMEELGQIPGMGERRLEQYGREIVEITKARQQSKGFPLDWVKHQVDEQELAEWIEMKRQQKQQAEEERRLQKKRLLELIDEGLDLPSVAERMSWNRRLVIDLLEQLDGEGYDISLIVEREINKVSEEERARLVLASQEHRHSAYLKPIFIKVYGDSVPSEEVSLCYEKIRLMKLAHN